MLSSRPERDRFAGPRRAGTQRSPLGSSGSRFSQDASSGMTSCGAADVLVLLRLRLLPELPFLRRRIAVRRVPHLPPPAFPAAGVEQSRDPATWVEICAMPMRRDPGSRDCAYAYRFARERMWMGLYAALATCVPGHGLKRNALAAGSRTGSRQRHQRALRRSGIFTGSSKRRVKIANQRQVKIPDSRGICEMRFSLSLAAAASGNAGG